MPNRLTWLTSGYKRAHKMRPCGFDCSRMRNIGVLSKRSYLFWSGQAPRKTLNVWNRRTGNGTFKRQVIDIGCEPSLFSKLTGPQAR